MDYQKQLIELIKKIKEHYKKTGRRITQEAIAEKMYIGKTYLSNLISGTQPTSEKHVTILREQFHAELSEVNKIGEDKPTYDQALLKVILREVAKLKAKSEKIDYEKALEEIDDKVDLLMS